MATVTLPTWCMIAADATHHREQLLEHVRRWGAAYHAVGGRALPSRWLAAWDLSSRPVRSRMVDVDTTATDRDRAEAAADDLWDATAVAWQFVRWAGGARLERSPPLEHVVAELHAVGRWLAVSRVFVATHDLAVDRLFRDTTEVAQ